MIRATFLAVLLVAACNPSPASSNAAPSASSTTPGSSAASASLAPAASQSLAPTFAPISLSGEGNKVPRFTIPENAAALATITHHGSSNFSVTSVGADGADIDLLVNVIGDYSGTVLFDAQAGQHSVAFKIEADGSWTATILPLSAARPWDPATPLAGEGDQVVLVRPAVSGLVSATITHDGSSNFAVTAYADSANLIVNEIGKFSGDEILPSGTFLLQVQADGNWTVTPQ